MQQPESTQRRRWPTVLLGVVAVGLVLGSGGFGAWHRMEMRQPWPTGKLTYYNATNWGPTLKAAVRQWNRVDFGVRFVEVDDPEAAELVVKQRNRLDCPDGRPCIGLASHVGYRDHQSRIELFPPRHPDRPQQVNDTYVMTIVHELGHVLGLAHERTPCAVMTNSGLSPDAGCPDEVLEGLNGVMTRVPCGPFEEDLEQLAALYGIKPPPAKPYCHERRYRALNMAPRQVDEIIRQQKLAARSDET